MGPQGNDPECPCKMRAKGLQSTGWTEEEKERLTYALSKMYEWEKNDDICEG
jgi:hypothetical protein